MEVIAHGKLEHDARLRQALRCLREQGLAPELHLTQSAGEVRELAARAGLSRLLVAGGDGTLHAAVGGVYSLSPEERPVVGVLPLGTGNDFARGAGIPLDDIEAAARLAATAQPTTIDLVSCNEHLLASSAGRTCGAGVRGPHVLANVATGGFLAEVTTSTPDELKQVLGGTAYWLAGLVRALSASPVAARVRLPEAELELPRLFVAAVCNNRYAGGGYPVAPEAELADGLLDVLTIADVEAPSLEDFLTRLTGGTTTEEHLVERHRAAWVEIETEREIQFNLDGEPVRGQRFRFEVLPRAIPFALPDA